MVGEYVIEHLASIPIEVEYAEGDFAVATRQCQTTRWLFAISQSREAADTLGALRESRRKGHRTRRGFATTLRAPSRARAMAAFTCTPPARRSGVAAAESLASATGDPHPHWSAPGRGCVAFPRPRQPDDRCARGGAWSDRGLRLNGQNQGDRKKYVEVGGMLFFGRQFNFPIAAGRSAQDEKLRISSPKRASQRGTQTWPSSRWFARASRPFYRTRRRDLFRGTRTAWSR